MGTGGLTRRGSVSRTLTRSARSRSERCRVGLGWLSQLPLTGALERLYRAGHIDVHERIELLGDAGGEPVAGTFALGPGDDPDGALQPRLAQCATAAAGAKRAQQELS